MLIDTKKLWKDGGYGKDNKFENAIGYVYKVADQDGIDRNTSDKIIFDFFMELKEGKKHSTEGCSCGCGSNKSGTDAVHYMIKKVKQVTTELQASRAKVLEDQINAMIVAHIKKENKKYTKSKMKTHRLLDWSRSPVLKGIKWTFSL
jgi:hypothetical protein